MIENIVINYDHSSNSIDKELSDVSVNALIGLLETTFHEVACNEQYEAIRPIIDGLVQRYVWDREDNDGKKFSQIMETSFNEYHKARRTIRANARNNRIF